MHIYSMSFARESKGVWWFKFKALEWIIGSLRGVGGGGVGGLNAHNKA